MAEYVLKKQYQNFYGIDLKSTDLVRPTEYASGILNAEYRKSGAIQKRKGYHAFADNLGGHGLFTYQKVNPETGIEEPEVISVSNKIHKLNESIFTVSYSGVDPTATIDIFYDVDTEQYRCQITEGSSQLLDQALGLGFDESSPYTLTDLKTVIDALTGFAATISGATDTPAAFLKTVRDYDLSSTGEDLVDTAGYWTNVNITVGAPFAGSETNKNSLNFENATAVNLNNVLFITNGYDEMQKYDGQTLYRVGVPTPSSITSALGGAGSVTGSNYQHVMQYIQIDAVGNVVEGNNLKVDSASLLTPAAQSMDVTVANVENGTGFNTNCAIVAGTQSGVTTITVDDGSAGAHTMKAGDTAYFFDGVTGDYITRTITSITSSTITISGAAVNVADNAVISNNLRIAIYRNKTSATTPSIYFLVAEIPNNSFAATQVYNDDLTDASLGAQFVEPLTDRSPPPKGKYVSAWQNLAVLAGNITSPKTFYWSDIDGPEYWPSFGTNQADVETSEGDIITGIAPNNELFAIFSSRSITTVTGDITNGNIRVDQLTRDVGCVAHATIQEVRGALAFLSDRGPYFMTGGQLPAPIGEDRIEPVFDRLNLSAEILQLLFGTQVFSNEIDLRLKRAVAINDRNKEKYMIYIPTESTSSVSVGDRYANSQSKVFVFDYARNAWLIWDNINAAGGMTVNGDEFYFSERRESIFNSSIDHILYRFHNNNDAYDYQDNNLPVNWKYDAQWESLGEPSILKRFLRHRFFDLEEIPNNTLMVDVAIETNYIPDVSRGDYTIEFPSGGYGVSEYGEAPYGNPIEPAIKQKLSSGRTRALRLRYSNDNDQENVVISGWELEIALPNRQRFKR